jgi:DNA-binding beta-propeller fold protein YncE
MRLVNPRLAIVLLAAVAILPLSSCFPCGHGQVCSYWGPADDGQVIIWNYLKGLSGSYNGNYKFPEYDPNQAGSPENYAKPRQSFPQQIFSLGTATLSVRTASSGSSSSKYSTSVYLLDSIYLYQMDPTTNGILRSLDLTAGQSGSPSRFAITSDNKFAVVTNSAQPNQPYVLMVDLASFTVAAKISIPENANAYSVAITPDNLFAYMVTQSLATAQNSVYVVDLNAHGIAATIPLPKYQSLQNIVMTPDGTEVYLNSGVGVDFQIPLISTVTNAVVTDVSTLYYSTATGTMELSSPAYLAMHPDGSRVYLAPIDGSPIFVLDTATNVVTHVIQIPKGAASPAGTAPVFTPSGTFLFILDGAAALSAIDTRTDTLYTSLPLDATVANGPPGGTKVGFYFVPGA